MMNARSCIRLLLTFLTLAPSGAMLVAAFLLAGVADASAQSTINATSSWAWTGNLGWTNWRSSAANGVRVGEFVCSGWIYSANVGWISLGGGAPANGIQYANSSASDFGVNFKPTSTPGVAALRGLAYGANIGWINFENSGNATLDLTTGKLAGYAWSANCGWLNLGSATAYVVKTDTLAPDADSNDNGIPDPWELLHFGNLNTTTTVSDHDRDGVSDLNEFIAGTDPLDPSDRLRILSFGKATTASGDVATLTFTSNPSRLYLIEYTGNLAGGPAGWKDSGLGVFVPDGATTLRSVATLAGPQRFYRVRVLRPLQGP